jgi:hypothetical protein
VVVPGDTGTGDAPLGPLLATATGVVTVAGTADAALGALAAAAVGAVTALGAGDAPLGALDASGVATGVAVGTGLADLGALLASATGQVTVTGLATAELGALTSTAVSFRVPIAWPPTASGESVIPVATGYPVIDPGPTADPEIDTGSNTSVVTGPGTAGAGRVNPTPRGTFVAR